MLSLSIIVALLAWMEFVNQDFSSRFTLQKEAAQTAPFLYLIRIMWLLDSPAEDVLLIQVSQEILSVHSLKITSLTSHCGFGDLFPGAGSQIFQNTH